MLPMNVETWTTDFQPNFVTRATLTMIPPVLQLRGENAHRALISEKKSEKKSGSSCTRLALRKEETVTVPHFVSMLC